MSIQFQHHTELGCYKLDNWSLKWCCSTSTLHHHLLMLLSSINISLNFPGISMRLPVLFAMMESVKSISP